MTARQTLRMRLWLATVSAARRRPVRRRCVRLTAPGAEPRTLAPGDPAEAALVTAAEAVLSAAQRASRR